MMKRFALLVAALFVASMVLVAPVFASGNHENNNGGDNEQVCVLHKDKGDDHNNGEHKDNNADNGHANNNDDDNGHANNNDDDNGHANNSEDDWS